jgi:hypothetical protein
VGESRCFNGKTVQRLASSTGCIVPKLTKLDFPCFNYNNDLAGVVILSIPKCKQSILCLAIQIESSIPNDDSCVTIYKTWPTQFQMRFNTLKRQVSKVYVVVIKSVRNYHHVYNDEFNFCHYRQWEVMWE